MADDVERLTHGFRPVASEINDYRLSVTLSKLRVAPPDKALQPRRMAIQ
jgi:hypothetical protein